MICISFGCLRFIFIFWHSLRTAVYWNIFYAFMFRCCRKNNVVCSKIHLRKETTLWLVLVEKKITFKHPNTVVMMVRWWKEGGTCVRALFSWQQFELELCKKSFMSSCFIIKFAEENYFYEFGRRFSLHFINLQVAELSSYGFELIKITSVISAGNKNI